MNDNGLPRININFQDNLSHIIEIREHGSTSKDLMVTKFVVIFIY